MDYADDGVTWPPSDVTEQLTKYMAMVQEKNAVYYQVNGFTHSDPDHTANVSPPFIGSKPYIAGSIAIQIAKLANGQILDLELTFLQY